MTRGAFLFLGTVAMLAAPACKSAGVSQEVHGGESGNGTGGRGAGGGGGPGGAGGAGGNIFGTLNLDAGITPTGKGCGNGVIDANEGERCDDGNKVSGDGCTAICQIEANWECPEPGKPCKNLAVCGNGIVTSNETCDDGNTKDGDGCSADCKTVERGWQCRVPGKPCTPHCEDGVISGTEICDDGNTDSGDGCSATCRLEFGYKCVGEPSVCTKTTCGDGKVEGAEGCDDGNTMPFDGCSADCQNEPSCGGASCTSKCGDGIVLGEVCDDGNQANGDGCSKDCKKEDGWTCSQPDLGDTMMVPVIYRDFRYHNPADFQASVVGQVTATLGIVKTDLDTEGKPVYTGLTGGAIHVDSQTTFAQWYRNTAGVNHATASKMALYKNPKGAYVNRYGANGEQWNVTEIAYYCGNKGEEMLDATGNPIPCTSKYQATGGTECTTKLTAGEEMLRCYVDGTTYKAIFILSKVDGNPVFFPVDDDTFTPASEREGAQIPPDYDGTKSWPYDLDAAGNRKPHNFSFTSEVRYWFIYDKTKSYTLDFTGDDDVWVFINKKLAVDLGGIHTPVNGSTTLNAATAANLGLVDGKAYEAAVFQAERQTTSSTYKLTLSGFNAAPSACVPTCGDGVTVANEECDNGKDNSDTIYGGCTTKCTWGDFCGDNVVNGTEECDYGKDNGTQYGDKGCTVGCTKPHYCGDNVVDTANDEECDLGSENGGSLCTKDCKFPFQ